MLFKTIFFLVTTLIFLCFAFLVHIYLSDISSFTFFYLIPDGAFSLFLF